MIATRNRPRAGRVDCNPVSELTILASTLPLKVSKE